jgi:2-methylisocitrate lyase-like PEP mutase family enzyme
MQKPHTPQEKANEFRALHHSGELLILPNIWDPLGARMLEELGYPAIATASASVAFTNGYDDGEQIPINDALARITQIAKSVQVPVTADFESAYADNETQLQKNIEGLLQTGVVGLNFEDYDRKTGSLYPTDVQCRRIGVIRKLADGAGIPLFINARTDVYLRSNLYNAEQRLNETINRSKAYQDAGSDCLFAPGMKSKDELSRLINAVKTPVNIIAMPGIPDFDTLKEIGIARLSLGPGFLRIAISAMRDLAVRLNSYEGLAEVLENEITTEYLRNLVKKH